SPSARNWILFPSLASGRIPRTVPPLRTINEHRDKPDPNVFQKARTQSNFWKIPDRELCHKRSQCSERSSSWAKSLSSSHLKSEPAGMLGQLKLVLGATGSGRTDSVGVTWTDELIVVALTKLRGSPLNVGDARIES